VGFFISWYQSLYWRIAIGVVSFLAVMLVVQAMLFIWALGQSGRSLPGQSPARFGQMIALDVATELTRDPDIDLVHYLNEQYSQYTHPFFVLFEDGRLITVSSVIPGTALVEASRALLHQPSKDAVGTSRSGRGLSTGSRAPGHEDPETVLANANVLTVPIVINTHVVGVVGLPRRAPYTFLLARFAPMLSGIATLVLIVGGVVISGLTFGPPRRRLQSLEMAARRLGAGDLRARAIERGGDEITAVSAAFNAMAMDLEARADALAVSDRTRRQLLADVSHELNTPITAMRGYLETLRMTDIPIDEETRERYLGIVSDETARLERLVGDLLELARLESGGLPMSVEDVPVAELFARVAARQEQTARMEGVTIVQSIATAAALVRGDRVRLEQALQNLAANALRYAPPGSTLRLSSHLDDGAVTLSVQDEGAGITPAHIPHIFDRFYKADPSRHNASGSGLGLCIVKAVTEQHGGRISVRSRPGRTVFEMAGLDVGYAAANASLPGGETQPRTDMVESRQ